MSNVIGRQNRRDREVWKSRFPDKPPLVRLLSQNQLSQIGLKYGATRYQVTHHLEEGRLRDEERDWPRVEIAKPQAKYLFKPLNKLAPLKEEDDQMLKDKQMEADKLLDDHGMLTTSDPAKRIGSELYTRRSKRPRIE